jgi:hypothetical protein
MSMMISARDEQRNRRILVVDCKWCAVEILDKVEVGEDVKCVFGCGEEAHRGDDDIVAGRAILMFCQCGRQKKAGDSP